MGVSHSGLITGNFITVLTQIGVAAGRAAKLAAVVTQQAVQDSLNIVCARRGARRDRVHAHMNANGGPSAPAPQPPRREPGGFDEAAVAPASVLGRRQREAGRVERPGDDRSVRSRVQPRQYIRGTALAGQPASVAAGSRRDKTQAQLGGSPPPSRRRCIRQTAPAAAAAAAGRQFNPG